MRRSKKGDLKFTLDGYKLKGSWVLVRTGGRYGGHGGDGARSWLLIKHRDDWAGDLDIAEFAPRSVKSDGDFEDILAADNPDVWVSNRPAKGGETGAMLAAIIKKAAALKAQRRSRREADAPTRARAAGTQERLRLRRHSERNRLESPVQSPDIHHAQNRLHPVQRRRGRRRGRVRRLRRAPRHRRGELHLRRPQGCPQPRHPRAQSRGAAGGRRQPRVRVEADAPPLHRQSDDSEESCRRSGIR